MGQQTPCEPAKENRIDAVLTELEEITGRIRTTRAQAENLCINITGTGPKTAEEKSCLREPEGVIQALENIAAVMKDELDGLEEAIAYTISDSMSARFRGPVVDEVGC